MEQKTICCLRDLVDAFTKAADAIHSAVLWWRGEADSSWPTPLVPKVYRGTITRLGETGRLSNFRREAPARYPSCPSEGDYAGWLFLMQHHGLATRLLDWTESLMVAAFFAVKDVREKQGRLWVLDPRELNRAEANLPHILVERDPRVNAICQSAFDDDVKDANQTVAFVPTQTNPRMTSQYSMFTIHGSRNPLNEHVHKAKFLAHFDIPSEAKRTLFEELRRTGIRLSILFPDLDHLAEYCNSMEYVQ